MVGLVLISSNMLISACFCVLIRILVMLLNIFYFKLVIIMTKIVFVHFY
jgi:hypothetical protein